MIVSTRAPDIGSKPLEETEDPSDTHGLEACARDLLRGINTKDEKAIARAFKAAFEICESNPHSEDTEESNDYDSLNQLAAKKDQS